MKRTPSASLLVVLIVLCFSGHSLTAQVFRRGDADGRSGINITDAVQILRFLFAGQTVMLPCIDAADVDDDSKVAINDGIYLLNFLFLSGPAPLSPFPDCGPDPTEDALGCESFPQHDSCIESTTDGFFFVVDRSGSMLDRGELSIAKREVARSISEFSSSAEFGIVFFDRRVVRFPADGIPIVANDENKSRALEFVNSVRGGSGGCIQPGFFAALDFADRSNAGRSVIIYISDGGGNCSGAGIAENEYHRQTLEVVTARNQGRVQINCIGVRMGSRPDREMFLKVLAAMNGGTYRRIDR